MSLRNPGGHDEEFQAQLDYQARVDALNAKNALYGAISSITGEPPTEEELAKYSQYAGDLDVLRAVLTKDFAKRGPKGEYVKDINSAIMSKLGREATESELNYFGKQMEQGNLDSYGLESFIKGTEEFQTNYTKKAREDLKSELGATDQDYLNKVNTALQAKYAAQGRQGAGAFGSSLIQAGKDLASERGSFLANIGYQGAQQGIDTLKGSYQSNLNQMYNNQGYGRGLSNASTDRYYSTQAANNQYAQEANLMALRNQYAQQNQPTFMQGLAPGLVSAGGTVGAALIM